MTGNRFVLSPRGELLEDPRGAQVIFPYRGRELLGDVYDAYFDEVTGTARLRVRYFNREEWPTNPPARSVTLLARKKTLVRRDP